MAEKSLGREIGLVVLGALLGLGANSLVAYVAHQFSSSDQILTERRQKDTKGAAELDAKRQKFISLINETRKNLDHGAVASTDINTRQLYDLLADGDSNDSLGINMLDFGPSHNSAKQNLVAVLRSEIDSYVLICVDGHPDSLDVEGQRKACGQELERFVKPALDEVSSAFRAHVFDPN